MSQIRFARLSDAERIRKICSDLTIDRASKARSSFVKYPPHTKEEWERRIEDNPFFYVIEQARKVIGFFSNYTDSKLAEVTKVDDKLAKIVLKKPAHFIYNDLLRITPEFQGQGIANRLIEKFLEDTKDSQYPLAWTTVSHAPYRNVQSIRLMESFGWNLDEEIQTKEGLTFGLYRKEL